MSNPCVCLGIWSPSASTVTTCPDDCIVAPHLYVPEANSVSPCNVQATTPFDTNCPCLTACGDDPVTFTVVSTTSNVTVDSLDENGITYTSVNTGDLEFEIVFKIECGLLGVHGSVTGRWTNLCRGVDCPEDNCNPCTGDCDAVPIDLSLDIQSDACNDCDPEVPLVVS